MADKKPLVINAAGFYEQLLDTDNIVLTAAPTENYHGVNKAYVDAATPVLNLQDVTDNGNVTTLDIYSNGLYTGIIQSGLTFTITPSGTGLNAGPTWISATTDIDFDAPNFNFTGASSFSTTATFNGGSWPSYVDAIVANGNVTINGNVTANNLVYSVNTKLGDVLLGIEDMIDYQDSNAGGGSTETVYEGHEWDTFDGTFGVELHDLTQGQWSITNYASGTSTLLLSHYDKDGVDIYNKLSAIPTNTKGYTVDSAGNKSFFRVTETFKSLHNNNMSVSVDDPDLAASLTAAGGNMGLYIAAWGVISEAGKGDGVVLTWDSSISKWTPEVIPISKVDPDGGLSVNSEGLTVVAAPGYGIEVAADGLRLSNDWSNILEIT